MVLRKVYLEAIEAMRVGRLGGLTNLMVEVDEKRGGGEEGG